MSRFEPSVLLLSLPFRAIWNALSSAVPGFNGFEQPQQPLLRAERLHTILELLIPDACGHSVVPSTIRGNHHEQLYPSNIEFNGPNFLR